MRTRIVRILSSAASVALAASGLVLAPEARALDLNKHFMMGVRLGDFLPADEQQGGFRAFGGLTEGSVRGVNIDEVPTLAFSLGYGVAKLGKTQLVLEAQIEYIDAGMGPETVYRDPDASTRLEELNREPNGDEEFYRMGIGDITMMPIFVNALFHWSGSGGRADFYAGAGLGVVLADVTESAEFRSFKSDAEGDDLAVDDAFGVMVKAGSNVSLKRDGNWLLYFEAQFISTQLFSSEGQVRWSGSDYFAGTQDLDLNGDNVDEVFDAPADLRIVDPGKFRIDGATIGLGLRYRFGGKRVSASAPPASEETPAAQP